MKFFENPKKNTAGYDGCKILSLIMLCLLIMVLLSACNLPVSSEMIRVWIDVPVNGLQVNIGQIVQIEGHAASQTRIETIDLLINGVYEHQIENPEIQGSLTYFRFQWTPSQAGDYALQIIAYAPDGHSSQLDTVVIHVSAQEQEVTLLPQLSPTLQLAGPTATIQVILNTPLPSATLTITPSPLSESTQVPEVTTTLQPTQTPQTASTQSGFDAEGPPAPEIKTPSNGLDFPCISSLTLQWETVSDPSGITEYRVEVEYSEDESQWYSAEGSPFTGLSTTVLSLQVDCGYSYRWRVQAVDGYRNSGEYSNWSNFAVSQE